MRSGINVQEKLFAQRRSKLLKEIKGEAALFPSAPVSIASRDQSHAFRQNTDLFYLTGVGEPETALLLVGSNKGARSVLFLRERDPVQELWGGERIGIRRARRSFQVDEVRNIDNLEKDLKELLAPVEVLHYAIGANPRTDNYIIDLLKSPIGPRAGVPSTLKDSRLLTSAMRFIKDKEEIRLVRHAVDITAAALTRIAPELPYAKSERHAARMLESIFSELGADGTAFDTIVASGKNATELHHTPSLQPLWKSEPVLIDCGASFRGYAGDITRCFPVHSPISGAAADIYEVVLKALDSAKKRCKPGESLSVMHQAALHELVSGMISLKIFKGAASSIIGSDKYKSYFPHRIGHWLGLDVHDVSPLFEPKAGTKESSWERPFVPGNVLTIEPGLYFHPEDERVPKRFRGIGIRIEDSVLITDHGHEVLSSRIPTGLNEISALLS